MDRRAFGAEAVAYALERLRHCDAMGDEEDLAEKRASDVVSEIHTAKSVDRTNRPRGTGADADGRKRTCLLVAAGVPRGVGTDQRPRPAGTAGGRAGPLGATPRSDQRDDPGGGPSAHAGEPTLAGLDVRAQTGTRQGGRHRAQVVVFERAGVQHECGDDQVGGAQGRQRSQFGRVARCLA